MTITARDWNLNIKFSSISYILLFIFHFNMLTCKTFCKIIHKINKLKNQMSDPAIFVTKLLKTVKNVFDSVFVLTAVILGKFFSNVMSSKCYLLVKFKCKRTKVCINFLLLITVSQNFIVCSAAPCAYVYDKLQLSSLTT